MTSESLSIIVPVFNSNKFIEKSINCLRQQVYKNITFILVDDNSEDESYDTMVKLTEGDCRFKILKNNKNYGYGYSVNRGIDISDTDFIAIFEPDDYIPEDFYSELMEYTHKVDMVKYNGIYKVKGKEKKRLFRYRDHPKEKFNARSYGGLFRSHPSVVNAVYRKSFLIENQIRFCTGAGASFQDVQFTASLYRTDPIVYIVDSCKYCYIIHENQSTANVTREKIRSVICNWLEEMAKESDEQTKNYYQIQIYRQFHSLLKKAQWKDKLYIYSNLVKLESKNISTPKNEVIELFNMDIKEILFLELLRGIVCLKKYI